METCSGLMLETRFEGRKLILQPAPAMTMVLRRSGVGREIFAAAGSVVYMYMDKYPPTIDVVAAKTLMSCKYTLLESCGRVG
jgi:hypothetical protein